MCSVDWQFGLDLAEILLAPISLLFGRGKECLFAQTDLPLVWPRERVFVRGLLDEFGLFYIYANSPCFKHVFSPFF